MTRNPDSLKVEKRLNKDKEERKKKGKKKRKIPRHNKIDGRKRRVVDEPDISIKHVVRDLGKVFTPRKPTDLIKMLPSFRIATLGMLQRRKQNKIIDTAVTTRYKEEYGDLASEIFGEDDYDDDYDDIYDDDDYPPMHRRHQRFREDDYEDDDEYDDDDYEDDINDVGDDDEY